MIMKAAAAILVVLLCQPLLVLPAKADEGHVCANGDSSASCVAATTANAAAIAVGADGSFVTMSSGGSDENRREEQQQRPQELSFPQQGETPGAEPPMNISPEEAAMLYGEPQSLQGYDASYLLKVDEYMRNVVAIEDRYQDIREHCLNKERQCTYWANLNAHDPPAGGECDKNPAYMLVNCGPACLSCHKLIFEERCPIPPDHHLTNVWKEPGDLNSFFERIVTHPHYQKFHPNVICKPGMDNPHVDECPWVVTLDDFLTPDECDALIELGAVKGYKRSEDVGERKPDGTYAGKQSQGRTSTNAWCQDECYANATVKSVLKRIENLTGIPDANGEYLQLLRYEVGQFYESHHDYIEHNLHRSQGPRIITVFLYLNDVEAGGETHFTDLNISVFPKRGRALVWPSVLDEDPTSADRRTHHQAKPVLQGIKYGANAWIHLRDFKTPFNATCI